MRNGLFLILAVFVFSACEKDISVNLPVQESQLVVEGKFESGRYPEVVLTRSLNFFSKMTPATLLNAFVHKALVTVSDGSKVMTLYEQAVDSGNTKFFIYKPDSRFPGDNFTGKPAGTYTLRIQADNKTYESVTTIPSRGMKLDSVWWNLVVLENDSAMGRLWVRITDSPEFGNYGRYFTRRNKGPFLPGLTSVIDDQLVNGTTFEIPVDAGVNKNEKLDLTTYAFFNQGDTVTMKFCNIDKATWDFWRTLDFAYNSNGNPFSSPTKILGNIPGALGYWGGYAVTYKTIIISK
ncbi:MAG: DUF4249 domain-containing protein [Chitinophaga sp.]|uniref:DUF4249 domain-containing protein n=1 Tax=Chitinophaga sp. TaxID=1869181 RepID=UPI001B2884D8|nr:DUF4249 domain-containing protein [Chitinophaga sp.]MBO9728184.1 DUF4249 domain-containing protein [Chitinophaga sp.]